MYVPRAFRMADADVPAFLDAVGAAELVTVGADGYPVATLLPFVRAGERLLLHMSRANPHWQAIGADAPALAIVTGAQAYVSPRFYPSAREHGRAVPTWNYSSVQLAGRARVHEDPDWLLAVVSALTRRHEAGRPDPWSVEDAPAEFIRRQLQAIIGVELIVERVAAKAKLSQNRPPADRAGVLAGLQSQGSAAAAAVAKAMQGLPDHALPGDT